MLIASKIHESMQDLANRIAAEHGCDLQPDAAERTHIVVLRYHSQGDPADKQRERAALSAMETAGVFTTVRIGARSYEDCDDALSAAETDYASEFGLQGWNLVPRWEDDRLRDAILLTVPASPAF